MQSYFLIFGLSSAGVTLPIMAGAVLALVINIGAYTCEIMRAGIESIHKGQLEAGECLALSPRQVFGTWCFGRRWNACVRRPASSCC